MVHAVSRYQVGGSLAANSPHYVERPADAQLYQALAAGTFCYVLNARQMGKSSLLVHTKHHLEQEGVQCAAIDLTGIGSTQATPEQWYKGLFVNIFLGLDLSDRVNFKAWWQDHSDVPLAQRIILLIQDVLLTYCPDRPIVIFIDEIDTVQSLPFSSDDFFALIRFCYNQRSVNPHYNRITFALFGVANPANLIQDAQRTPFNIGTAIPLTGFTLSQTAPLIKALQHTAKLPLNQAKAILTEILNWTGGQPFLTQKLCQLVAEKMAQGEVAEGPSSSSDLTSRNEALPWLTEGVATVVQSEIIEDWESKDIPEHLITIARRVLWQPQMAGRLLGLYQRILAKEAVRADYSPEQTELLLSGLVVNHKGMLQCKNKIYPLVFDTLWVEHHLQQLRPYAPQLNRWLASGQSEQLLQGMALKEALAWARDKQLSDTDYRFLGASQEQANQSTEQELKDEKHDRAEAEHMVRSLQTATQVFAQARQTAQRRVQTAKLGRRWIGGITAGVTASVLLLRLMGLLQGLEWLAFDTLVRYRPIQATDTRITIVTIDEPDIRAAGSYPLSGQVLATGLQQLSRHQPAVIGFDIFRDVPVEPGHDTLVDTLGTLPQLIGIEKVIDPTIAALPVLTQQGQVGFADQVVDGDGTIRRMLLSVTSIDEETLHLSFALRMALKYLEIQEIFPESLDSGATRLGQATLTPFEPNTSGFYVSAEDGGYQMLLNYRGTVNQFETVTLEDVVAGQVDPRIIRDRIVLLGFTAESINDLFPSPYSHRLFGSAKPMAGITLHANMVSQILSASLDGRPLLRVWSQSKEWLWIATWGGIGAMLSWKVQKLGRQIGVVAIATVSLVALVALAFVSGWWIPLVPPLLTLLLASTFLPIVTAKQRETLQLQQTVMILADTVRTQPLVGQIAIAYLKQVEGQDPQRRRLIQKSFQQAGIDV